LSRTSPILPSKSPAPKTPKTPDTAMHNATANANPLAFAFPSVFILSP
jgi:hypothetical protein